MTNSENRPFLTIKEVSKLIGLSVSTINHLVKKDFIVDEKFSLADIPLGIWCHRCVNLNISFDNFQNINNWYIKLKKMNSFQNTVLSAPLPPN